MLQFHLQGMGSKCQPVAHELLPYLATIVVLALDIAQSALDSD